MHGIDEISSFSKRLGVCVLCVTSQWDNRFPPLAAFHLLFWGPPRLVVSVGWAPSILFYFFLSFFLLRQKLKKKIYNRKYWHFYDQRFYYLFIFCVVFMKNHLGLFCLIYPICSIHPSLESYETGPKTQDGKGWQKIFLLLDIYRLISTLRVTSSGDVFVLFFPRKVPDSFVCYCTFGSAHLLPCCFVTSKMIKKRSLDRRRGTFCLSTLKDKNDMFSRRIHQSVSWAILAQSSHLSNLTRLSSFVCFFVSSINPVFKASRQLCNNNNKNWVFVF